jgi:hypothetical protein
MRFKILCMACMDSYIFIYLLSLMFLWCAISCFVYVILHVYLNFVITHSCSWSLHSLDIPQVAKCYTTKCDTVEDGLTECASEVNPMLLCNPANVGRNG